MLLSSMQASDFGPKTSLKIVDSIREEVKAGKVKTKEDIRRKLKETIISVLQPKGSSPELQLGGTAVSVILVIGVNGGGKTTTIGKLAHKLGQQDAKVPLVPSSPAQCRVLLWSEVQGLLPILKATCALCT